MQAAIPQFYLLKSAARRERFVHARSDGARVVFGFSTNVKAGEFRDRVGLRDEWEIAPFEPHSLIGWLEQSYPEADVLALDAARPDGELLVVDIPRVLNALRSQNPEGSPQAEFHPLSAEQMAAAQR